MYMDMIQAPGLYLRVLLSTREMNALRAENLEQGKVITEMRAAHRALASATGYSHLGNGHKDATGSPVVGSCASKIYLLSTMTLPLRLNKQGPHGAQLRNAWHVLLQTAMQYGGQLSDALRETACCECWACTAGSSHDRQRRPRDATCRNGVAPIRARCCLASCSGSCCVWEVNFFYQSLVSCPAAPRHACSHKARTLTSNVLLGVLQKSLRICLVQQVGSQTLQGRAKRVRPPPKGSRTANSCSACSTWNTSCTVRSHRIP